MKETSLRRPTIPDLAKAANVSVASVNRVLSGKSNVRQKTRERVLQAAKEINFYATNSIEKSFQSGLDNHKIGILLQQGTRGFYKILGDALQQAANDRLDCNVELDLEYLDDLTFENVANRLLEMGEYCESIAVVAPQHQRISAAIDKLLAQGIPVAGLITPLHAVGNVSFIGLDHWKVGRTAAWAFDMMVKTPGKIGILVGNHRYRNQELNESGFRSYFREHNEEFTLLEPLTTYESSSVAREVTEKLLSDHPDLCGLFVSGGGITGAVTALRNTPHRRDFITIGYDLFDFTREALLDGSMNLVISHPMQHLARETVDTLIKLKKLGTNGGSLNTNLGFEIHTPENV